MVFGISADSRTFRGVWIFVDVSAMSVILNHADSRTFRGSVLACCFLVLEFSVAVASVAALEIVLIFHHFVDVLCDSILHYFVAAHDVGCVFDVEIGLKILLQLYPRQKIHAADEDGVFCSLILVTAGRA